MRIPRMLLKKLVFGTAGGIRFTQDSPVMPDVWFAFGERRQERDLEPGRLDLLMVPRRGTSPTELADSVRTMLAAYAGPDQEAAVPETRLAFDESYVVAEMDLPTLVRVALPLSGWWKSYPGQLADLKRDAILDVVTNGPAHGVKDYGAWLLRLLGPLIWAHDEGSDREAAELPEPAAYVDALEKLLAGIVTPTKRQVAGSTLWSINRNRTAEISVWSSSKTIKSDAATRLFELSCKHLTWAVLDTGIDARHPAFRLRNADGSLKKKKGAEASVSRVVKTYDFTRIRKLLDTEQEELPEGLGRNGRKRAAELRRRLRRGQAVDWSLLEQCLEIDHGKDYEPPVHPHGTHVAGIIAADWKLSDDGYDADDEHDMVGVCPDLRLYDLRVLDENGTGDEFSILAAMQFIRYLNSHSRRPVILGANMSLSIPHDVSNFACGRTPVCEEAKRLHGSGVVVVAAAGNKGHTHYMTPNGLTEAYQNISITDPGNADEVLTVGATHRRNPHTYGVSYFSSRGPTGDGRAKPDLVAPGEKIKAPVPDGGAEAKDGTSMAAPHVSGAAALIMSRHPEFIGDPARIKRLVCETATDLGRERYFQGAGLLDVCRALQSI